ncbi:MAG: porin family protein [Pseudolabrys sp.]|nr:porin family protein [Pseudolabrys sp.]MDP2294042.1 porin family protein [Pseudolabrys sp.]
MTRKILAAFAGLFALAMASPSSAADMPRKAPAYYVAPFSWSGSYVGINGGYGWGKTNWSNALGTTGDFNTKGAILGGTLGYNLQTGVWVWGLEGDFDYSWINGSTTQFCGAPGCETRNRWLGTVRGRIGYAFDRWLPYITGGAAIGDLKMTPAGGASDTKTKVGWTVGAGLEYALLGAWSVKAEYLYVDLGKATCGAATCGVDTDVKFNTHLAKLGLNYRF